MTSLDRDAARARIFVLGGFRIVVEGRELRLRTRKEAMLLLRLALAGEGGIRRDELVAMLWPDSSEARARHSLSEALRGIEMATGVELQRSAERIAVASSDVHTDLSDLDEAIDRGDVHELNRLFIGGFLAGWYPPTAEASHWTDAIAAALATRLEKVARAQLASRRKATDSRGVSAVVALLERLGAATAADREAAAEAEQITGWDALRGDESIQSRLPLDREGRFVGREEEMKSLTTELERALAGEMRVVLVSGEAGIGKTRVCQRLARIAALRGARMLLTNCYELEQPIPFAAASGTFASVSSSEISQLNAAWQRTLRAILPEIAVTAPDGGTTTEAAGVYATLRATSALFDIVGSLRPVFLLVDDLQWADATSCQIFHHVIRRSDPPAGGLILLSFRPNVLISNEPAHLLIESAVNAGALTLHLRPLSDKEIKAQVAAIISKEIEHIDDIVTLAAGNPLFARQLAYASDDVRVQPGSFSELIAARIQNLPDDERLVLQLLSVAGTPLLLNQIARIHESSITATLTSVQRLRSKGFLKEVGTSVIVSHELLRLAVYDGIGPSAVPAFHSAIAKTLQGEATAGFLAYHYNKAGERHSARTKALDAAADSHARKAYKEEVEWLLLALEASEGGGVMEILQVLVPKLFALAMYSHAVDALSRHRRHLDDEMGNWRKLATIKCATIETAPYEQLIERALEVYEAFSEMGKEMPAIESLRERMRVAQEAGDMATVFATIQVLDKFATTASESASAYAQAVSLIKLAVFDPAAMRARLLAPKTFADSALPPHVVTALDTAKAMDQYNAGHLMDSARLLLKAVRESRRNGELGFEVRARSLLVPIGTETLRFDRARKHAEFVLTYSEFADTPWERLMTLANLSLLRLEEGEFEHAERLATAALKEAEVRPWRVVQVSLFAIVGYALLRRGQLDRALQVARRIEDNLPPMTEWVTDMSIIGIFLAAVRQHLGQAREGAEILRDVASHSKGRYTIAYWNTCVALADLGRGMDGMTALELASQVRSEALEGSCHLVALKAHQAINRLSGKTS